MDNHWCDTLTSFSHVYAFDNDGITKGIFNSLIFYELLITEETTNFIGRIFTGHVVGLCINARYAGLYFRGKIQF